MQCWAFLGVAPHAGGTYSVFRNLRAGLEPHGIQLRWVVAGSRYTSMLDQDDPHGELAHGEGVCLAEDDERVIADGLRKHLLKNYSGAVANVLCDKICTNLMRYMPADFKRIVLVHNITLGTYETAAGIREYVHGAVGVSHRIAEDLVSMYKFDSSTTSAIPNSVAMDVFTVPREPYNGTLRVLVLSRIENQSKGCFRVPKILQLLESRGIDYRCTVAGDGRDLEEMKQRCSGLNTEFIGRVSESQVAALVSRHDAYLFPSNYEGFGISLVEAMAGGCVPVSSRLRNVTDRIVEDRKTGFLVPCTDVNAYTDALEWMVRNPEGMADISGAAQQAVRAKFSTDVVAAQFSRKIREVGRTAADADLKPLPMDRWRYPKGLRGSFRSRIPESVKNLLRHLHQMKGSR